MDDVTNPSTTSEKLNPQHMALKMSKGEKLANFSAVILPFVGLIVAMVFSWGQHLNMIHLSILIVGYLLTAIGITVGYHRYFTHKSFETYAPIQFILAVLGSMALEGPVLQWVAQHRRHHQHSDEENDPHTPHGHGTGFWNMCKGIWHAHAGWILNSNEPSLSRYVVDLIKSPMLRWTNKMFLLWAALGLILPAVAGGLLTMSWYGAFLGFLWGGAVRIFLVHHVTWSINSVCHIWGQQHFTSHDESRNNPIFGILALGEGWHNNHHAFPASARHGLLWWQIDFSYILIKTMEFVGLAWKVRVPSQTQLDLKKLQPGA